MQRYLLAIPLLMTTCLARALDEAAGGAAPSETVSIVYVILFGVLFVGMIAGFFVYLWWQERHRDPSE